MSVNIVNNLRKFADKNNDVIDYVLGSMAMDIERLAKMQVPHDTGQLQNSIRHMRIGLGHFQVQAGTFPFDIPYARRWEYETPSGGFRKGRKSRYMRDSAETILSKGDNYFKRAMEGLKI